MTKAALGRIKKKLLRNNPGMLPCELKRLMREIDSPLARISTHKCLLRGNHSDPKCEKPYGGRGGKLLLADDIEFLTQESYGYLCKLSNIESLVKFGRLWGADE